MANLIDVMHIGNDRVIGAWELEGGLIVDPGPASDVEALLAGLREEPRALMLTHIHLDHAGASGVLCRRFPQLEVYVHERGAPHLADPSKLLASAERLYGDDLDRLWGEVAPVPEERINVLRGGEKVEKLHVSYTPGHASHHVCYLGSDGAAYAGDVAGVRIPPSGAVVPPTPPPDIDVELWLESVATLESWKPECLRITHFGQVDDVGEHLDRFRAELRARSELAAAGDRDGFMRRQEETGGAEAVTVDRRTRAAPPDQQWAGLERYWRKRREAEGS